MVQGVTAANTAFNVVSSVPLWNIEINGTTNNKYLDLRIYPLTLKNNLIIDGNSRFRANGLDIVIGGSLINNNGNAGTGIATGGYQAGSATQITTFNGTGTQNITGSGTNITNFANLVNTTSGSLILSANSNIRINTNLTLNTGTLDDNGNTITLIGNLENNASHISTIAGGGIFLAGSQTQKISGNGYGEFGNVTVNNATGINVLDNCTINGQLTFTSGSIYIDDYLLTFGTGATVSGMSNTRMIVLNGVISDEGVRKIFASGVSGFTFPIGVAGKYTPVTYNFTANTNNNASITVKPVNYAHPALSNAAGDELAYYWNVVSSGFAGAYTVSHTYNYLNSDVSGNESLYYGGRYLVDQWVPPGGIAGAVNASTDQINLSGVNYIDGEYTAGTTANFAPNKPTLYSIQSGNWFDGNTWSTTGHTGLACGCTPDGNPVEIDAAHTITINSDNAVAYSVLIHGVLDIGQTVFHNLGHVKGDGTMKLTSTPEGIFVFPGGNYDVFLQTTGSTLEFTGGNDAYLPLKPGNNYKPYQNVIFSGNGKKLISAEDLKVLGNLTMQDGTSLSNEQYNRTITTLGDWTDNNNSATGGFLPGKGKVSFNGSSSQSLSITNSGTTEQFYNLGIDNSSGITISGGGDVAVNNRLYLTNGNINTSDINLLNITNTSPSAVIGGGSSSFVNGPLRKSIISGGYFDFPVGDSNGSRYGEVSLFGSSLSGDYLAQYFNHNPGNDGYNPASFINPIDTVSNTEYWRINGPASATADVAIRWDSQSGIIPSDAATRQKLRIVEWNSTSTAWESKGDVVNDGGVNSGNIQTNPEVDLDGDHHFTIGVESLPTAIITSTNDSICDDGSSTNIAIDLTGTAPWTIQLQDKRRK